MSINVKIDDTGEDCVLHYSVDHKCMIVEMLTNYDAVFKHKEEEDIYQMNQHTFDWWNTYFGNQTMVDDVVKEIFLESEYDEINIIKKEISLLDCNLVDIPFETFRILHDTFGFVDYCENINLKQQQQQ